MSETANLSIPFNYLVILPSTRKGIKALGGWIEGKQAPLYELEGAAILEYASITPFLWGLTNNKEFSGQVVMQINQNGVLETRVDLNLNNVRLNQPIVGYQEIVWGYRPWGLPTSHPILEKPFRVPIRISNLPRVILHTQYDILNYNSGIDLSYDLWLFHNDIIRKPESGDYEVMIWLYYDSMVLAGWATKIGEFVTPIIINGNLKNVTWEVWIKENHGWGWTYVALLLKEKTKSGEVLIDLYELLRKLDELLRAILNKTLIENYMIGIEFGMEISYREIINVLWKLEKYTMLSTNVDKDTITTLLAASNYIIKS